MPFLVKMRPSLQPLAEVPAKGARQQKERSSCGKRAWYVQPSTLSRLRAYVIPAVAPCDYYRIGVYNAEIQFHES